MLNTTKLIRLMSLTTLSITITLYRKTSDIYISRSGIYQHVIPLVLEILQDVRSMKES